MSFTRWFIAAAVTIGASSAAQATIYTLTFDADVACGSLICADAAANHQSYGDTALVDLSYQRVSNPGESAGIGPLA